MKKKLTALLLCVMLLISTMPAAAADSAAGFSDITDSETAEAANALRGMGVVNGTTDTTFSPDNTLTRAHVCKMIISAMGLQNQVSGHARKTLFSDVSPSSVFAGYINLAYAKGIFQGYGDGTFGPGNAITYGQLATVLLRMLGYTTADVGAVWPTDYTAFCERLELNGSLELTPYQTLNRGQAAILIYNALKANTASGKAYYTTIGTVASTQTVTILDVDARQNNVTGLLRYYTASGSSVSVKHCRQANPVPAVFVGHSGILLLNSAGKAVGFLPDSCDSSEGILQDTEADSVTVSGETCDTSSAAVVIVGESVYSWSGTGYLQGSCYPGQTVRVFRDDIGDVTCVYIPVDDEAQARKLAVTSTQNVILVSTDAAADELTAYVMSGSSASIAYYDRKADLTGHEGQLGTLLLNKDGDAVGFIPSSHEHRDITVSSARLSGIVDNSGVSHRIPGSTALIVDETVYTWKDNGYLRLGSHAGETARLYYDDSGSVSCVQLLSGSTAADTRVLQAETVTAAGELARRLGISGTYSITKNGMSAAADDLARYDIAYFDEASRTLRASDYQFTGYIEAASPNVAEAETITVGGHEFTVLDAAWESLGDYTLGSRVTLLLTDDLKVAMATTDSSIVKDILGVLDTSGKSVTLLGSGLTMTADTVSAQETLYGGIVRVTVSKDQLNCYRYSSSGNVTLNISDRTLGSYALAPDCAIYEHTSSGGHSSHVYSLSGEPGKASYNFDEILWTDTLPALSVTAWHLNSAGKVDMLLLNDVTGNCYEYGQATKYTGTEGINVGSREMPAYSSAVTITNAANRGEGVKRICVLYEARTDAWLGVSPGTYSTGSQRVVSLRVLSEVTDVETRHFFLTDDRWYVTADAAEIPVSTAVQVYVEATDTWLSGEDGMKAVMDMAQTMTVYYDRSAATGAQIRVIVVHE